MSNNDVFTVRFHLARIGALPMAMRVIESYGTTEREVFGGSRSKCAAAARHRIWMILRHTLPDMSYPEIGRIWGGVDHTTIIAGVRKCETKLAKEHAA